ncbi:MAG: MerR family transcriptional regulator [Gammaproteobacteria bacterium]|nr:MerR family transcriptional regulator [Gammaproteobacteria bacterium]
MLATRTYSITEMQAISGFDRRTIVYYLQQGLVPRAGRRGPNTRYSQDALLRLRFIRGFKDMQDQGRCGTVTLREIGALLGMLEPAQVGVLVERGMPMEDLAPLLERVALQDAGPSVAATPAALAPIVAAPAAAVVPAAAATAATPTPDAAATPPRPAAGLLGPSGPRRSYGLADAGIRQRVGTAGPTPEAPVPSSATTDAATTAAAATPASPSVTAGVTPANPAEILAELGRLLRELELRPAMSGRRLAPGASEQWTEIPITSRVFLSVRGLSQEDAPLADAVARELKKVLRGR